MANLPAARANLCASPINQRIAIKTAEKLGFGTKAASNGQEALDYLAESRDVDVILMDCQVRYNYYCSSHSHVLTLPIDASHGRL